MIKKRRNVAHKNNIVSEDERICIFLNSKENKAVVEKDGFEHKTAFKSEFYKKISRILFGSDTVQFEYYSIMKDYWKEKEDHKMTREEAEQLLSKIKKNIDMRVYNILKEIDSKGDSSNKRRMDYVNAMMDVGERRKGESRREYRKNCTFERNQALRRVKININYEIEPSIKSLPIILSAMKAKKLAGSSIKVAKKESNKDEKDIQNTKRLKPVNFKMEDLKRKATNLQFRNKIKKMRFGAVLGVFAILGWKLGDNVAGPAIVNNMTNNIEQGLDATITSEVEKKYTLQENDDETTIMDIGKLINGDTKKENKTLCIDKLLSGENQEKDEETILNIDELIDKLNEKQNKKEEAEQPERDNEMERQDEEEQHLDIVEQQTQEKEEIEEEQLKVGDKTEEQLEQEKEEVSTQPQQSGNGDKKVNLKDMLMDILNIGFDSEINNLKGIYYATPEQSGNYGRYREGAKKVGIVDVIKDDGYITIRPENNINFSEIKKAYPDARISYHVTSADEEQILGWNLSTENEIEEKMVKTALHNIKPYIVDDTETMQFLCENDINSDIDANEYKEELKKIRQAVEQYEIDKQAARHSSQGQGDEVR